MSFKERITWEKIRSVDTSTLSGSYVAIGTPLANPGFILKFVSTSNVLVTVSIDGVNDYDVLPAGSFFLYDQDTSGNPTPEGIPTGTQFYIKGPTGVGLVYMVTLYLY